MIRLWQGKTIRTYFIHTENKERMKRYILLFFAFLMTINAISCKGNTDNITNNINDSDTETSVLQTDDTQKDLSINKDSEIDSADENNSYNLYSDVDNELSIVGELESNNERIVVYYKDMSCIINHYYSNMYNEMPQVLLKDLDEDGEEEVVISIRKYTGSKTAFSLFVCDVIDNDFSAYELKNIGEMVEEHITYIFDTSENTIEFKSDNSSFLAKLPDYIDKFPLTGKVEFENRYWVNCEKMELKVLPEIEMEKSLPYTPVYINLGIDYKDGKFKIYQISFEESDW